MKSFLVYSNTVAIPIQGFHKTVCHRLTLSRFAYERSAKFRMNLPNSSMATPMAIEAIPTSHARILGAIRIATPNTTNISAGIRSIYYMIGLFNGGMTDKLNQKQIDSVMTSVNQEKIDNADSVAERIVRSLYIPKVINTNDSDEGVLVVRKDGFFL